MTTYLMTAVAILCGGMLAGNVSANPVPDPSYDLSGERVVVLADRFRSYVTAGFSFRRTAYLLSDKEDTASKLVTTSDEKIEVFMRAATTSMIEIYFPVFIAATQQVTPLLHKEVDMQAYVRYRGARDKVLVALASLEDIAKSTRGDVQAPAGAKIAWFRIALPFGFMPDEFALELQYTQASIAHKGAVAFAYMPLLPKNTDAAKGDFKIEVRPPAGKALVIHSRHRYEPTDAEGTTTFWPVNEELIMVSVRDTIEEAGQDPDGANEPDTH